MKKETTTLNRIREGMQAKIVRIDAGRGLNLRIKSLGILEGDTVKVIHNTSGPIIIAKGGLRLALGRGMSQKIIVEEI
ncbi:MAG: ferrous iron transport protein A [Candidatus Aureabacteria bacterium]|nr:ferrous iron transport protein A [Candidatus Auribacterota bacterium]